MKRPAIADARDYLASAHDTGQCAKKIDTGQSFHDGLALEILNHDIHKWSTVADDTEEAIMSTLRKFNLRVGLRDANGTLCTVFDGIKLRATLLFEAGAICTDLSQTLEPPLLGGEAILDGGEASFELRITVLSSLCRGNKFRIRVAADSPIYEDSAECHVKDILTMPMRTITKLHRSGKKASGQLDAGTASPVECISPVEWPLHLLTDELSLAGIAAEGGDDVPLRHRTKEELWAEVTSNGDLILELQQQQQALFAQLRKLQAEGDYTDGTAWS